MMDWIPIRYRDFYDIPRAFVIERGGLLYFFDCPFDERADEYPDYYRVYRLDPALSVSLGEESWQDLADRGSLVGEIPTVRVRFDETRRKFVNASILDLL